MLLATTSPNLLYELFQHPAYGLIEDLLAKMLVEALQRAALEQDNHLFQLGVYRGIETVQTRLRDLATKEKYAHGS